jgi:hypothetical protein
VTVTKTAKEDVKNVTEEDVVVLLGGTMDTWEKCDYRWLELVLRLC